MIGSSSASRTAGSSAASTTGSSPATRASSPATTSGSTANGRCSSTPHRSSSSRRASSTRTSRSSTTSGPVDRQSVSIRLDRTVGGGGPRGPRHRQLRATARPPDDRGRDRLGLRRHLRRPPRRVRPARRDQHPLVPVARRAPHRVRQRRRSSGSSILAVEKADSPTAVRQRPARLRGERSRPKGVWHTCLKWLPLTGAGARPPPAHDPPVQRRRGPPSAAVARSLPRSPSRHPNWTVKRTWDQAVRDLDALRLEDPTFERGVVIPAAGVPVVRDAVRPRHARRLDAGDLRLPGVRRRARSAGSARCRRPATIPSATWSPARSRTRSATASSPSSGSCPTSRTTGPTTRRASTSSCCRTSTSGSATRRSSRRYLPNAEAALRWIDRYGDRDRDGLQEYKTRSSHGYYNQGWKDAGDAIPHGRRHARDAADRALRAPGLRLRREAPDGRHLRHPRPAEGRPPAPPRGAARCSSGSTTRCGGRREGTYYLGLDGAKKPIRSRRLERRPPLQSGIVPPERAGARRAAAAGRRHVVGLGHPDAVVRSRRVQPVQLPDRHVWPHDNAIIAGGFRRYGFDAEAARDRQGHVRRGGAAVRPPPARALRRTPPRARPASPSSTSGANVPQAWAAGAIIRLVAILAGIHATTDTSGSRIYVNPALPDWLP